MANTRAFAEGLCVMLQSFAHPRGGFYFRAENGKEVQIRHIEAVAPNRLCAILTDGEVRTITVD